jgi:hypothetical protein
MQDLQVKIEFLEEGSSDCPLIRLYGTDPLGFSVLLHALQELSTAKGGTFSTSDLVGFRATPEFALTLTSYSKDQGVRRVDLSQKFVWTLTPVKWSVVEGLVKPFTLDPQYGTYQWLSGREARYGLDIGSVGVVLSCSNDGRW